MLGISGDNFNINLESLKKTLELLRDQEFFNEYNLDSSSVFTVEQLELLKDIKNTTPDDSNENSLTKIIALKLNISIEEAKNKITYFCNTAKENKNTKYEAQEIARAMHERISGWVWNSIDDEKFVEAFNKINDKNILYVLENYKKFSKGESLVIAMLSESSADGKPRKEKVEKLFNLLLAKIDKTKYDTTEIETAFQECLNDGQIFVPNSKVHKKLDLLFDTMIEMVKGKNINEKAYYDLTGAKERNIDAQKVADNQGQQGKVSDALDWIAGVFGSDLTEKQVNEIIKKHEADIAELEKLKGDYKAFCEKFKEIFGIEYKPTAVANYNKINNQYKEGLKAYNQEMQVNKLLENVLKQKPQMFRELAAKYPQQAELQYKVLYNEMCKIFGEKTIENYMKFQNTDITMKFQALYDYAKNISDCMHKKTVEKCGGKEFEELLNQRNSAYHAAYGFNNDTYLKATDWQMAQQTRLATTQIGFNALCIAGAFFSGGGTLALITSTCMVANPVGFAEMATDANGMTKEDWNNYWKGSAETVGWMVLGMGAGKVAQNVSNMVKMKGLSTLMKEGGKSIDDLLKCKNLPADVAKYVSKIKMAANFAEVSTDFLIDITATAILQKEGVTTGDWLMSLSGALMGSTLANKLKNMPENRAINSIKETFPDLNISDSEARNLLDKILGGIKKANDKVKAWAETPTNSRGQMYTTILPISPVAIEKSVKFVARLLTDGIDKLFSESTVKKLNKIKTNNPNLHAAISEYFQELCVKICAGDITSKEVLDMDIIEAIAKKYEVKADNLSDYIDICLSDNKWSHIETLTQKSGRFWTGQDRIVQAKEELARFRVDMGLYTEEHEKAIFAMFKEMESRILGGEKPSKDMLDSVAEKYGQQYEVETDELVYSIRERMTRVDDWSNIYHCLFKPAKKVNDDFANDMVTKFKKARGIEEAPVKVEQPVQEVEATKTEAPTQKTAEQTPPKKKFELTDEIYEKYSYLENKQFFENDSRFKAMEIMEDYEVFIKEKDVNFDNFDSTMIYEFIGKYDINSNDIDRIYDLIKERFHKNIIDEEVRMKDIKQNYGIHSRETVNEADKLIDILKEKMKNGERITEDELEDLLLDNISDQRLLKNVEKLLFNDPQVGKYLDDCTYRSTYKKFADFDDTAVENAISVYEKLLAKIENNIKITEDTLYDCFGRLNSQGDEVLKDLIFRHEDLAKMYNKMYSL